MADDTFRQVEGIPISVPATEPISDWPDLKAVGLRRLSDLTLTGQWDDGTMLCGFCRRRFRPGEEGTPIATERESGAQAAICPKCFARMHDAGAIE